jgi:hypothetical protein
MADPVRFQLRDKANLAEWQAAIEALTNDRFWFQN